MHMVAQVRRWNTEERSERESSLSQRDAFSAPAADCLHYVEAGMDDAGSDSFMQPELEKIWLISSNPFDVIGARAAGLQAAWIRRSAASIYDPWGIDPTFTVATLTELYDVLRCRDVILPL